MQNKTCSKPFSKLFLQKFSRYQQNACDCKKNKASLNSTRDVNFANVINNFFEHINKAKPSDADLNKLIDKWGGAQTNRSEIVQALVRTHSNAALIYQESELVELWHHNGMTETLKNGISMLPSSFEEAGEFLEGYGNI
mgnify:CR=1 FL=1